MVFDSIGFEFFSSFRTEGKASELPTFRRKVVALWFHAWCQYFEFYLVSSAEFLRIVQIEVTNSEIFSRWASRNCNHFEARHPRCSLAFYPNIVLSGARVGLYL